MIAEAVDQATKINQARQDLRRVFDFRGNNAAIWRMQDQPVIVLSGPAGTGKTLSVLAYIHQMMLDYPGARALFVREKMDDLRESTLVTWEEDVIGVDNVREYFGTVDRQYRRVYQYPNGSRVVLGGMSKPGKWLSAQYDIIYPGEMTQLKRTDLETLVMRNRNSVVPHQQVIGDTNPGPPTHWIKQMEGEGGLVLLDTTHKDNPAYWDDERGEWTERGRDYVTGKLEMLSGVMYDRYRLGLWVAAEGAVYTFVDKHHVISREAFEKIDVRYRVRAIDFGFRDPFVCLWLAVDHDNRVYVYREVYQTERLVSDHAKDILDLTGDEKIRFTVADSADAEGIATLNRHGVRAVHTSKDEKDIMAGIQAVQKRLRILDDKKPSLYYVEGSLVKRDQSLRQQGLPTSMRDEFGAYLWDDNTKKEAPIDAYNHGMDALRYGVRAIDLRGSKRLLLWDV